jgi:Peptidase inhibitor family I36
MQPNQQFISDIQLLAGGSYMHTVPVTRKVFLSALVALALFVGAMFVATPRASASQSQCSRGTVCVWSGSNFDGNFSWWPAGSTGCHSHANNPNLRSGWNRTGYRVRIGGDGFLYPDYVFNDFGNPVTGLICWPA